MGLEYVTAEMTHWVKSRKTFRVGLLLVVAGFICLAVYWIGFGVEKTWEMRLRRSTCSKSIEPNVQFRPIYRNVGLVDALFACYRRLIILYSPWGTLVSWSYNKRYNMLGSSLQKE